MNQLHYGLDIGGTKIEIAVFDSSFNQLKSWREPTPADNRDAFFARLQTMVAQADREFDAAGTIGIGFPGIIKPDGRLLSANLTGLTGKDVRNTLNECFDRPVAIDNDCRCFTRSEISQGGAADGAKNVFGAIIGTGAGAGIAVDGDIYYGNQFLAGEWGHLPLSAELQQKHQLPIFQCGCGLTGCLEQYIAGPGLARLYHHIAKAPEDCKAIDCINALREGDESAAKTFQVYMDVLGSALANVVKLNAPDMIVLGGGLSNIDEILEALPEAISQHHFPNTPVGKICRATYGDSSGVRGAAILGAEHTLKSHRSTPEVSTS